MDNRPRSRGKNVLGGSGSVHKRGSGLGTGPVGTTNGRRASGGGYRPSGGSSSGGYGGGYGGGGGFGKIIGLVAVVAVIFIGFKMFTGGGSGNNALSDILGAVGGGNVSNVANVLTDLTQGAGNVADEFQIGSQGTGNWRPESSSLNTRVATGSRAKYTEIKGNGQDVVTLMVYLCGTDLESKHGMATADLQEMMKADFCNNVNLIVYTGGCKKWTNNVVSSNKNQIYQVKNGKLVCLEKDMGSDSMTKPATLTKFIQYCTKNYPANRNMLIFWDHGGGSLSGYGYDEKNASSGSMGLGEINDALKAAGTKFDFIGFDACLMATLENALMLSDYADYVIASEETEPGVGWYYVNWLTALGKNTSMPTIEIGQKIVDDFVEVCDRRCNGQKTTLSVVDLAELEHTVPDKLTAFASAASQMIENNNYQAVADARYNTREFAQSSRIDQVDLVHLAQNLGNSEGKALENAVLEAVKYNRTSANMSHSNGISIYFPYKNKNKVSSAEAEYKQIGMDSEYTKCIRAFASIQGAGQAYASQNAGSASVGSPLGSLIGSLISGGVSGSAGNLLEGLTSSQQSYVTNHSLDSSQLVWKRGAGGKYVMSLSESQWKLVKDLDLNVFVDDGEGYIDLGLDNVFDFDENGALIGDYDGTWMSINGQIVAYYRLDSVEERNHYSDTGYVPVMINGTRAELILVFDDARPNGYIAGARDVYKSGETNVVAKNLTELKPGDQLDFLCDYYTYSGTYKDTYYLVDPMIYDGNAVIGNLNVGTDKVSVTYRPTDIYQQQYWTPVVP